MYYTLSGPFGLGPAWAERRRCRLLPVLRGGRALQSRAARRAGRGGWSEAPHRPGGQGASRRATKRQQRRCHRPLRTLADGSCTAVYRSHARESPSLAYGEPSWVRRPQAFVVPRRSFPLAYPARSSTLRDRCCSCVMRSVGAILGASFRDGSTVANLHPTQCAVSCGRRRRSSARSALSC